MYTESSMSLTPRMLKELRITHPDYSITIYDDEAIVGWGDSYVQYGIANAKRLRSWLNWEKFSFQCYIR